MCCALTTASITGSSAVRHLSTVEWHFNLRNPASNANSFQILKGQIIALNYSSVKLFYFATWPLPPSLRPTLLCGSTYISEYSAEL